jgi:hypothetical protein
LATVSTVFDGNNKESAKETSGSNKDATSASSSTASKNKRFVDFN